MATAATAGGNTPSQLEAAIPITIHNLSPNLQRPNTRAVHGEVTLVWPYSRVTRSIAFTIAERDPLLRREHGQIRVTFAGACAKPIVDADVASGDEVLLSLDGAEWEAHKVLKRANPSDSFWQLKFTSRVLIQVHSSLLHHGALEVLTRPRSTMQSPSPPG